MHSPVPFLGITNWTTTCWLSHSSASSVLSLCLLKYVSHLTKIQWYLGFANTVSTIDLQHYTEEQWLLLCFSAMNSAQRVKASISTLQRRKRHSLSLPACSSVLGALLLLWDHETGPQALLCLLFGRDMWRVCAHLGEQELGSSRGTSDSTAECTRVLSAENQHWHHYWPVCHFVEHTRNFSLLLLAPV